MATPVDVQTVIAVVTVAASAGAAWAGVRAGLNGMRETVKRIDSTLTTHVAEDQRVQVDAVRAASRIETKVEGLDEKIGAIADYVDQLRKR